MDELYHTGCRQCQAQLSHPPERKKAFQQWLNTAEKAFKRLFKKGAYHPQDLAGEEIYTRLIDQTYRLIEPSLENVELPKHMKEMFRKDIFFFSGIKTHTQLLEASRRLLDSNGQIKPFRKWFDEVRKYVGNAHKRYLEAEYEFAVASVQMAHRWHTLVRNDNPKRVIIQYRTAGDERVRASHRPLHNITLPASDPFWEQYYPPNGWRCRCTAVRVPDDHKLSDPRKARKLGEKATTYLTRSGKNKLEIFRFHPAKAKRVFPPRHPYWLISGMLTAAQVLGELFMSLRRYDGITWKKVKGIKNGGELLMPVEISQNKYELLNNKQALLILANNGGKYAMLPVINDGLSNADAFNLVLKILAEIKTVTRGSRIKTAFQNGLKSASKQKAGEFIFFIKKEANLLDYKDLIHTMKLTILDNRNKSVKYITIIFPDKKMKTYARKELEKRWKKQGKNKKGR